jgi:pseudouridine-5'-monophosphatase
MGKSALETCKILVEYYKLDTTPEALMDRRTALVSKCWKDVKLLPGAMEIVSGLESRHIPMAIATSSRRSAFEEKCESNRDFYRRMHHSITGSDITQGKPNPEIFLSALAKWPNVAPEEALVVEDSPLGIKAANAAGMPSVFVPDSHMNAAVALAEQNAEPTLIIPSLLEFDFEKFTWAGETQ